MMKFLSISLALNMFFASTGVTLYKHMCNLTNDAFVSIISMSCGGEGEKTGCCAEKAATCHIDQLPGKEDCCDSQGEYYKQDIIAMLSAQDKATPEPSVLNLFYSGDNLCKINAGFFITPNYSSYLPEARTGPTRAALQVFRC